MKEGLLYKELSYQIIGICMEVHSILGKGHSEVVYKDALEYELSWPELSTNVKNLSKYITKK